MYTLFGDPVTRLHLSKVSNRGSTTSAGSGSGSGGGGCFIATAAYGSPLHPYLKYLRDFRDRYLMTNQLGREFVHLYYRYSPLVAASIAERPVLRLAVGILLLPFVAGAWVLTTFSPGHLVAVFLLCAGIVWASVWAMQFLIDRKR